MSSSSRAHLKAQSLVAIATSSKEEVAILLDEPNKIGYVVQRRHRKITTGVLLMNTSAKKRHPDQGPLSPEVVASECVKSFIMAVFGENLGVKIVKNEKTILPCIGENHRASVNVEATFSASGHNFDLQVTVPIEGVIVWQPEQKLIPVIVGQAQYAMWCSPIDYDNFKTITLYVTGEQNRPERWYVADSFEDEVLFRGEYSELPSWAKEIANKIFLTKAA